MLKQGWRGGGGVLNAYSEWNTHLMTMNCCERVRVTCSSVMMSSCEVCTTSCTPHYHRYARIFIHQFTVVTPSLIDLDIIYGHNRAAIITLFTPQITISWSAANCRFTALWIQQLHGCDVTDAVTWRHQLLCVRLSWRITSNQTRLQTDLWLWIARS